MMAALRTSLVSSVCLVGVCCTAVADGSQGITLPQKFPLYNPAATSCTAPPGLKPTLIFEQDNARDFMRGVSGGLERAARDRGLRYEVDLANNDSARMVEALKARALDKVGAVVAAPVNPDQLKPVLQKFIWAGGFVGTVVPPPAVTLLNAPQYATGKILAEAAARYITKELGGKANVVLLTHDSLQFLAPRFTAMRDVLADLPGVTIVADITPITIDRNGGGETMNTILLTNSQVDVVLGADTVVLGALDSLRAQGKARSNQFLGGIDGEPDAVAEITKPDSPYKASISLASPIFGYALGQQAADWLQGKSVPQAMDILPIALTKETIAEYNTDIANPGAVYADVQKRSHYLKMYGNICYDTRDNYVDFPWSSESQ